MSVESESAPATPGNGSTESPATGRVLEYWNQEAVESMYDKHLLNGEISLLSSWIPPGAKLLDAGCGEGEGTLAYSRIAGTVHAADFSDTRLRKAELLLNHAPNVQFRLVDFRQDFSLDSDYDIVVTQRFLINLMEWEQQRRVITRLVALLKPGGRLLMLEGSKPGVDDLNRFRAACGLPPIPVRWHNRFFDDLEIQQFVAESGWKLHAVRGLGGYFLLTRGVRPLLDRELNWDCEFNRIAASSELAELNAFDSLRFSRLKLWVVQP
jgi:ubiquinone/menaquinone biosynthesis C-methylase UbiE